LAIHGPLQGKRLEPIYWEEVRFGLWKKENPAGLVLHGVEKFKNDYAPADWENKMAQRPTVTPIDTHDLLHPRDLVVGVKLEGHSKAYPTEQLKKYNPTQDSVGSVSLLLVIGVDGQSVRCFSRQVGDYLLDLYRKVDSQPLILVDSQTGSEWDFGGNAVSGPLKGKKLKRIQVLKDYWFDWKIYNPETSVFNTQIRRRP
jgi:hypothetical protein